MNDSDKVKVREYRIKVRVELNDKITNTISNERNKGLDVCEESGRRELKKARQKGKSHEK